MNNLFKRILSLTAAAALTLAVSGFEAFGTTVWAQGETHSHKVCAGITHTGCTHTAEEWNGISDFAGFKTSIAASGNYYLTSNITCDEQVTISSGADVKLCLNGYSITGSMYVSLLKISGTLTLCDCGGSGSEGKITNSCTAKDGGGAVWVNGGGTFNMYGGSISDNQAQSNGGGVYVDNNGNFTMYDGKISNNTTKIHGGGVYVKKDGNFTMYGGTISDNKTTGTSGDGGGVHISEGTFSLYGGTISGNEAARWGGGVYFIGSSYTFTMNGGTISNNKAPKNSGGGVYINGGEFTMTDGEISDNETLNGGYGGGVCIGADFTTTFSMTGGKILRNKADYGGGINIGSHGTCTVSGGEIFANETTGSGGGIRNQGTLTVNGNSVISGNKAKSTGVHTGGGGIYNGGTLTIEGNSKISNNTAEPSGGGIINSGSFEMTGGEILENSAVKYGGGVYFNNGSKGYTFSMSGGKISENTVSDSGEGGGIYYDFNKNTLTLGGKIDISGNKKGDSNNNIYIDGDMYIVVSDNFSTESSVGVTVSETPTKCDSNPVTITTNTNTNVSDGFKSDAAKCSVVYNSADKVLQVIVPHTLTGELRVTTIPTAARDGEAKQTCSTCTVGSTITLPKVVFNDDGTAGADGGDESGWKIEYTSPAINDDGGYKYTRISDDTEIEITLPKLNTQENDNNIWSKVEDEANADPTEAEEGVYAFESDKYGEIKVIVPALSDTSVWDKDDTSESETVYTNGIYGRVEVAKEGGTDEPDNPGGSDDTGNNDDSGNTGSSGDTGSSGNTDGSDNSDGSGNTGSLGNTDGSDNSDSSDNSDGSEDSGSNGSSENKNVSTEIKSSEKAPEAILQTPTDELLQAVLTPEELKQAEEGVQVKIELTIDDKTDSVSEEDKAKAEAAAEEIPGCKVYQFLEVSLVKTVGGKQTKVEEISSPINVALEIPEEILDEKRTYSAIRIYNGETDILKDTDNVLKTITIKMDRFSSYAMVYNEPSESSGGDNPATGAVMASLVPLAAALSFVSAAKRKKK